MQWFRKLYLKIWVFIENLPIDKIVLVDPNMQDTLKQVKYYKLVIFIDTILFKFDI